MTVHRGWMLIVHYCVHLSGQCSFRPVSRWLDSHGAESSCLRFRALDKSLSLLCREHIMTVGAPWTSQPSVGTRTHSYTSTSLSAILQLTSSALHTCWTHPFHLSIMAPAPSLGMHVVHLLPRETQRDTARRRENSVGWMTLWQHTEVTLSSRGIEQYHKRRQGAQTLGSTSPPLHLV